MPKFAKYNGQNYPIDKFDAIQFGVQLRQASDRRPLTHECTPLIDAYNVIVVLLDVIDQQAHEIKRLKEFPDG